MFSPVAVGSVVVAIDGADAGHCTQVQVLPERRPGYPRALARHDMRDLSNEGCLSINTIDQELELAVAR